MRAVLILALALSAAPALANDAVGRVNIAGFNTRGMCTGTLVAPRVVLTAAHCVVAADGAPKTVSDMVFVAGWDGAGHAGASRVADIEVHPQAIGPDGYVVAHDVALLRLTDAVPLDPLGIGSGPAEGPFTLTGYPRSTPHRAQAQTGCAGRAAGPLWRIDCPIERGMSGGPVVFGEPARVVAVISARSGAATLAVPVDGWLRAAVARLR